MEKKQEQVSQKLAKNRTRSPSYPSISLKVATERIKVIYEREQKNPVTKDTLATHWGYSASSSGLSLIIAALKKFNLMYGSETGKGELKLTDLALDITCLEENDLRRIRSIKKAALTPKIYKEIWDKFSSKPSESNLSSFLLREKNFNPRSVGGFIKDFTETVSFANLNFGDKIEENEENNQENLPGTITLPSILKPQQTISGTQTIKQASFPLPSGDAYIRLPENMTETDKEVLFKYLDIWKETIVTKEKEVKKQS